MNNTEQLDFSFALSAWYRSPPRNQGGGFYACLRLQRPSEVPFNRRKPIWGLKRHHPFLFFSHSKEDVVAGFLRSFVVAASSPLLDRSVATGSANGTGFGEKIKINESPRLASQERTNIGRRRLQCVRRRQGRHDKLGWQSCVAASANFLPC